MLQSIHMLNSFFCKPDALEDEVKRPDLSTAFGTVDLVSKCCLFLGERRHGIDHITMQLHSISSAYSRYYNNNHLGLKKEEIYFLVTLSENIDTVMIEIVDFELLLIIVRTLALGSNWLDMHVKETINVIPERELKNKLSIQYSTAALKMIEYLLPHYIKDFENRDFKKYAPSTVHFLIEATMYAAHKACKYGPIDLKNATYHQYLPIYEALLNAATAINNAKLELTILNMMYFPVKTVLSPIELNSLLNRHIGIASRIDDHFEVAQTSYRLAILEIENKNFIAAKLMVEQTLSEAKLACNSKCSMIIQESLVLLSELNQIMNQQVNHPSWWC